MKILLLYPESSKEKWLTEFQQTYVEKISRFVKFEIQSIKTDNLPREKSDQKKKNEAQKILKLLKDNDQVILFDEAGKSFKDSHGFSNALIKIIEASPQRVVIIVGGAFGLDDSVKQVHKNIWSLSGLTMNHHVAQAFLLEQVYRALTIWKGIPYHN